MFRKNIVTSPGRMYLPYAARNPNRGNNSSNTTFRNVRRSRSRISARNSKSVVFRTTRGPKTPRNSTYEFDDTSNRPVVSAYEPRKCNMRMICNYRRRSGPRLLNKCFGTFDRITDAAAIFSICAPGAIGEISNVVVPPTTHTKSWYARSVFTRTRTARARENATDTVRRPRRRRGGTRMLFDRAIVRKSFVSNRYLYTYVA